MNVSEIGFKMQIWSKNSLEVVEDYHFALNNL